MKNLCYSKALRCTFFGELKSSCSSKLCIIRLWYVIQGSRIKNPCCWRSVLYSRCSCISSKYSVKKCAKTCISSTFLPKNVHLKVSFTTKHAKTCEKRAKAWKNVQKRASQVHNYQKKVHLKVSFTKKHAKTCKKRAKTCKNVHLKCFWTLFKNVHCQGPCILRPCISRPYCIFLFFSQRQF